MPFFFFKLLFNLFYFWLFWVFVAAQECPLDLASRDYCSLQCTGFSLRWLLLLQNTGCRHVDFSNCRTRAYLLCSMWNLPGPGIKPIFPPLAGGVLSSGPPRKSLHGFFKLKNDGNYSFIFLRHMFIYV